MENIEIIAYEFAKIKHNNQYRKGGITPYIVHPVAVVETLKSWGVDNSNTLAAAYLHDVLEDTGTRKEELNDVFGEDITSMVVQLTKPIETTKEKYIENIVLNADLNICLIKYADRICNVKDFIASGNLDYAKKYFSKISAVFDKIEKNKTVLGTIFDKINFDKNTLLDLLN